MLAAGTTLGPYTIIAPIGAGGMGEVYRARDTRLGRDVAVKVLPPHLAATPEGRARFEREARSISQLNHPHICTLHDVGHQDGIDFLVMELLDGESLEHRLERGPLPIAEVLALGRQIAEALDRAHRAGVAHRDLKPANVMLTKGGAKLVDFGLARGTGFASGTLSQPQTVSRSLTVEGTIVGTLQYMSPEQLEGKGADARSDIWALGCVLYEMATGVRAFAGESQASLIAAVFKEEPRSMTGLNPVTPAALDRLVRACLAKDPENRLQAAHDLALELHWIADAGSEGVPSPVRPPRRSLWAGPTPALALAAIAVLAAGWALRGAFAPSGREVRRFSVVAPRDLVVLEMRFAADGKGLHALCLQRGASSRAIWRREFNQFGWRKIAGSEGVVEWREVHGGRWLYILTAVTEGSRQRELRRIPVDGSSPATKVTPWSEDYASWTAFSDGRLVVAERTWKRFALIAPGASEAPRWRPLHCPRALAELDMVQALPDGRTVLAMASAYQSTDFVESCWKLDVEDGDLTLLEENASAPRLLQRDRILMTRRGTLLAARWDPVTRRLGSRPVAVLDGLRAAQSWSNANFAVSPSGDLGYVPGTAVARQRSLAVVRPDGRIEPWNDLRSAFERSPAISPDGRSAVVAEAPPGYATWQVSILKHDVAIARRFAFVEGEDCFDGRIAPNGRDVVWIRMGQDSSSGLWLAPIGGDLAARRIHAARGLFAEGPPEWYPDGRSVLANPQTEQGRRILLRVTPGADTATTAEVVRESYDVGPGSISPDGSRIAYLSQENGEDYVVVAALRSDGRAGDPVPVSRAAGVHPQWADNTTLLWGTTDLAVMGATVSLSLVASEPTKRFDLSPWVLGAADFEPLPDGSLLITRKADGENEVRQFDIVLNYRTEVERALKRAQTAER